jgi:sulfate adenylyltransferase subunit 1
MRVFPISNWTELDVWLCWLSEVAWQPARKYLLKYTTRTLRYVVRELVHRVDVNSLGRIPNPSGMAMNDIVRVELKLQQPILAESYAENRVTGSFILIDEATNDIVGAGVIV